MLSHRQLLLLLIVITSGGPRSSHYDRSVGGTGESSVWNVVSFDVCLNVCLIMNRRLAGLLSQERDGVFLAALMKYT